jgi:ABC-2 type transport system ATP-binding protein
VALIVRDVVKAFDGQPSLQGVSLTLGPGVIAVLGPNGAGKSTLLRLLATLIRPDAGEIRFEGRPYQADLRALRATLGYLPADLELPPTMSPRGLLDHLAMLKLLPGEANARSLLHTLGLDSVADTPLESLSGGEVRLATVAQAFLGMPRLVVLDEPTRGLDVRERERVFRLMRQPVSGRAVVFSTHLPDAAALIAGQLVILRQGRVQYSGTLDGLLQATSSPSPNSRSGSPPATLETAYLRLIGASPDRRVSPA